MLGHEILFIFFLTLTSKSSWAHVGLTFPPARQYDLDFLDNVRTRPPCGMPKGKAKHLGQQRRLKTKLQVYEAAAAI